MNYWLMKTEPNAFSWQQLVEDGKTIWDGVRNYQARNNLKSMKINDLALIYHSVTDKEIVGIAKVSKEFFQDPTSDDENWVAIEIVPYKPIKRVKLSDIKLNSQLKDIALIKQSRLSIVPLKKKEYEIILSLGGI